MKLGTLLASSPQLQKCSTLLRACTRWRLGRLSVPAVVLGGILVAQQMYWIKSTVADAVDPVPSRHSQMSPSGEQIVRRMVQEALAKRTFHEGLESTSVSRGVRETLVQRLDVDLRHHLLRQVGVDRRVRLPRTLLSQDTFERISVTYRSATRDNGRAWSCQHYRPGQVRLIGRSTYLASLGWPRQAVNRGPTVWRGVPVWRVQATVFGGGPAGGQIPAQRSDLFIARSDDTLLRETWRLGKDSTASATYSRYGEPVHIALPAVCGPHARLATAPRTVMVRLRPVGTTRVHGRATLTAVGGGTRVFLDVSGVPPGTRAGARIHYGTCSDLAHLSASSASLPNLRANAKGRARASGRVFTAMRRQNVRLAVLADGHHVIVIVLPGKGLVACGTIL